MKLLVRGCTHLGPTTRVVLLGECEPFGSSEGVHEVACFTLCRHCYGRLKAVLNKIGSEDVRTLQPPVPWDASWTEGSRE